MRDFDVGAETLRSEVIGILVGPGQRGLSRRERQAGEVQPEVAAELEGVRNDKADAMEAQDFERAAAFRDRERELRQQLLADVPDVQLARSDLLFAPRGSVGVPL